MLLGFPIERHGNASTCLRAVSVCRASDLLSTDMMLWVEGQAGVAPPGGITGGNHGRYCAQVKGESGVLKATRSQPSWLNHVPSAYDGCGDYPGL